MCSIKLCSRSCERGEQDCFGNEAMIYLIHLGLIYAELIVRRYLLCFVKKNTIIIFDIQIINVVYNKGSQSGIYSSSKILSSNQIIPMFITMVKSPRVIMRKGRDKRSNSGFKK